MARQGVAATMRATTAQWIERAEGASSPRLSDLPARWRDEALRTLYSLKRLGGGLVRTAIMACEEADEEGRRPSLPARAGAALPRLFRMEIGTR